MSRILLNSSSAYHGHGYMDHCETAVREVFAGLGTVLFVPYALADHEAYTAQVRGRLAQMGLGVLGIHERDDPGAAVRSAEAILVGGGNTFRLLREIYTKGLRKPIREHVLGGMPYMGSSAGSNLACPTIMTTNDMPIVQPPSFEALGLVPFQINPHYKDPDPESTHQGETREMRIREYHEENDLPVVGLREGAWLMVEDGSVLLDGRTGARVFRQGKEPLEYGPGDRLDFLLTP